MTVTETIKPNLEIRTEYMTKEQPANHAPLQKSVEWTQSSELNLKVKSKNSSYMVQDIYICYINVEAVFPELSQY